MQLSRSCPVKLARMDSIISEGSVVKRGGVVILGMILYGNYCWRVIFLKIKGNVRFF